MSPILQQQPNQRSSKNLVSSITTIALALGLSACAITPIPLTQDEVTNRVRADKLTMYAGQEAVSGPITFAEAAARALKYNLDYRVKLMETTLATGQLDVARWDMFPRVLLNAGYSARSNDPGGNSFDILTGAPTLNNSSSAERKHGLFSAEFSWNILDFGVSYFRSKSLADQVLVAEERKRKVIQNILQDVRNAYWRALGAQRLSSQMDSLMKRTQGALVKARQIETQGLMPQPQVLAYQRALLDATTLLQSKRQDLELSKAELIALMNLPPNANFVLAEDAEVKLPNMPSDIGRLEDLALAQRPELREEDYRKRISASEVKRQILSILPGISFDTSYNRDTNKYLYNQSWLESGLKISANLMRLASYPAINRQAEAQAGVDETRRMAQAMAVLTQVRVASLRYGLAVSELEQIEESARVDQRLLNYAKAATTSRVESELELIRNEARSLLSQYQRHVAYANAQAAWARLYNSIGLDMIPTDLNAPIKTIAAAIDRTNESWLRTAFNVTTGDAGRMVIPGVSVVVEQVSNPAMQAVVVDGIKTALTRYRIPLIEADGSWKVVARMSIDKVEPQLQRANWVISVVRPNGTVAGRTQYSGLIPVESAERAIGAIIQSAIDANSLALTDWLEDPMRNVAQVETTPALAPTSTR